MKRFIKLRITNYELRIAKIRHWSALVGVCLAFVFLVSCGGAKPSDLRALVPADTLVYLESNDLGKTLRSLTNNKAFTDAARATPDFSVLDRMQLAVAVTGFESTENQVTEEKSVLNFKPRLVAVADTHAWNWQAVSFTEKTLGEFVNEIYGGEVTLEMLDKTDGKSFVWTASDGRKAYAFVAGGLVFFGNDETALEKALSVRRGEIDSFAKSGKNFAAGENVIANGYVSGDGLAQIANLVGVSAAIEASDGDEERNFIAKVLPEILRKSATEIVWTATAGEQGIEDKYEIALTSETLNVARETLVPTAQNLFDAQQFVPAEFYSVTRYNLENPQIAWRSLLLTTAKQTDETSGRIIVAFAGTLFEPYGIDNAEMFLSAVGSKITTAQFDAAGGDSVVIAEVKNAETLKKSIAETDFTKPAEKTANADVWKSADGETAAAFIENKVILGDAPSVLKCLEARQNNQNPGKTALFQRFIETKSSAATLGRDSGEKVIAALGEKKAENLELRTTFLTETRVNEKGIERRTTSPFGLVGKIIEQFDRG